MFSLCSKRPCCELLYWPCTGIRAPRPRLPHHEGRTMANVSKLLFSTTEDECFLHNIRADDTPLKQARSKIRKRLREAFAAASKGEFGRIVRPRFFTQGSCAYRTLKHAGLAAAAAEGPRRWMLSAAFLREGAEEGRLGRRTLFQVRRWRSREAGRGGRLVPREEADLLATNHLERLAYRHSALRHPDKEFALLEEKAAALRAGSVVVAKG